jgi:hypothetical protein
MNVGKNVSAWIISEKGAANPQVNLLCHVVKGEKDGEKEKFSLYCWCLGVSMLSNLACNITDIQA